MTPGLVVQRIIHYTTKKESNSFIIKKHFEILKHQKHLCVSTIKRKSKGYFDQKELIEMLPVES